MVGGAIADSIPTPEPREGAFPSFGSSGYGPLSLAPLDDPDVLDEAQKARDRYVCGHGCPQTSSWAACFIAGSLCVGVLSCRLIHLSRNLQDMTTAALEVRR